MTSEGRLLENAPCSGRPVVLLCAGLQLVGEAPYIGGEQSAFLRAHRRKSHAETPSGLTREVDPAALILML